MYNRFFGFKERPFKLVPNPEYLYLSRIHEEVLAHLNYAAGYGEGFVAITGEVGTGKTTLCRMFLESLDENTDAAYIFNPKLNALQLLKAINDEFGIPSETDSMKTLIDRLNTYLLEKKAQDRQVLLLVDEAQNLSVDVLEQLRLLSNLETTTSKLLQIILVGQPELGELLETDALRQLNQRITLSCHLIPLTLAETRAYIRHRIHIASRQPGVEFSPGASRAIYQHTGGIPRLINIACDRALLKAFTLSRHRITRRITKHALRELDDTKRRYRHPSDRQQRLVIGLLVVVVILVAGSFLHRRELTRSDNPSVAPVVSHPVAPPMPTPPPSPSVVTIPETAGDEAPAVSAPLVDAAIQPAAPVDPVAADPPITLDQALSAINPLDSRVGALQAVLSAWKYPDPMDPGSVEVVSSDTFFRIAAGHHDMDMLRVQGNWALIETLNLPAILEFPSRDGNSRYLALVETAADRVKLATGQDTFETTPESLSGLWNGAAYILWKNFYNYSGVIPISSPGDVIVALKIQLRNIGFSIDTMTAAYDLQTRKAVESLQARHGLNVDGIVGPYTKIVLYNTDPSLAVPHLATSSGGG